jgi:hypothetical protein
LKRPKAERLKPWEELEEDFDKYIYVDSGTKKFLQDKKGKLKDEDDPVYHLYEAIETFDNQFTQHFTKPDREEQFHKFVEYLLNNVYVVIIRTSELSSAIRLFQCLEYAWASTLIYGHH